MVWAAGAEVARLCRKHSAVPLWICGGVPANCHALDDVRGGAGNDAVMDEAVKAIIEYVAHRNTNLKLFFWTKSARDILQKVIRANRRLQRT